MTISGKKGNGFSERHIGPNADEQKQMLSELGLKDIDELMNRVIPSGISIPGKADPTPPLNENRFLEEISEKAARNKIYRSYIGQGYYDTIVPSVILRNLFENPGWYTSYTPYQAEISQGRLESLLNFQTMVSDLTGLPVANAGLLDEGTAAAEAMTMLFHQRKRGAENQGAGKFFVDENVFEQTKNVLKTRADAIGIELVSGSFEEMVPDNTFFGALLQYPDAVGNIHDYRHFIAAGKRLGIKTVLATDLLALTLLVPPGEMGADVAIGSTQRLGVPMGFGGPHAAFFAATDEYLRNIPGRIIGVSVDADGDRAFRMALQTREQHIRREKATSNICTAQALLANMAAMYAVYHGPEGLRGIATNISRLTFHLREQLRRTGFHVVNDNFFDTLTIQTDLTGKVRRLAEEARLNFFYGENNRISISIGETADRQSIEEIVAVFAKAKGVQTNTPPMVTKTGITGLLKRQSPFLQHPVFNIHHSETAMMRYIKRLENKDISLTTSMIPLGSCTMKLNAATSLIPVTWPGFANIHPFVPDDQARGYLEIIDELEKMLADLTGFDACSLQPNSGAQGEFAGLLAIKRFHQTRHEPERNIILIPVSSHGTNPASAVMAGFQVVVVQCNEKGDIDVEDLRKKATGNSCCLAGMMVTYPSTYGVFESEIKNICDIVHQNGGLVYMDGANMNAQAGFTSPGRIGADICHLNLHKTFAIPHGGGGPGVGPVCCSKKLMPFLPPARGAGQVSSAPFGSANISIVSYGYLKMLGTGGLYACTAVAVLNANYMMKRLKRHFDILYTGEHGFCAHEFIVDLRPFKKSAGIDAEDVAKRLMDFGFHAPTISFPVPGTFMIEPAESENKMELDRFCEAMEQIYKEIKEIEEGHADALHTPLKNAPHTLKLIVSDPWNFPYTREKAAFPLPWVREQKFWPSVRRIDSSFGDRHLVCTCPPIENYL